MNNMSYDTLVAEETLNKTVQALKNRKINVEIVGDEAAAIKRLHEYVFPLEDARMKATGAPGSFINKVLFTYGEMFGRLTVIFVKEKLGF